MKNINIKRMLFGKKEEISREEKKLEMKILNVILTILLIIVLGFVLNIIEIDLQSPIFYFKLFIFFLILSKAYSFIKSAFLKPEDVNLLAYKERPASDFRYPFLIKFFRSLTVRYPWLNKWLGFSGFFWLAFIFCLAMILLFLYASGLLKEFFILIR
ncbi:MAG: hypothetical protein COX90_01370 [Candidatus Nealsonbacteria bacterium CG_4_10_14_0_2_um_filter_38_17]|uniref:Uncharacterized protein n=2 Tax=Candidatus Nealsoniibacteriota TaxID=1817911 RepID=A0A2M7UYK5_9BACT|nr:MAG: hypothetical protein COX36_00765 [Candidatus Nealsonbacteria bacterium CG23_combo_of_CG06-09_8_20_14_all_38_19]PIZ89052.1 MAG: hypothetical protein COX90_01370 [Candidatus Nealsonbacteria bacterium CG_4_10_14_0_2_um_filter_38_17]